MTFSSFKNFLVEEEKTVFFTFGRMNPPTIGHGLLMDKVASSARGNPYRIYLSKSEEKKKNPIPYTHKVKFVRKMFPKHSRAVMMDKKVRNVFDIASTLYNEGYKNITMVVGSDRVTEFRTLLDKYNGVKARHGFYNFNRIQVISAGERDPDGEGVSGASASKQRAAASDNDFTTFSQGLPRNVSNADAKALFNAVRKGMGLKECKDFRSSCELEPVSEVREKYVEGELFTVGDQVVVKESEEVGEVLVCGTNYLIIELNGRKIRKWLDDVELIEQPQDRLKIAREKIRREKELDKKRHDRMLDRARHARTREKNKGVKVHV